MDFGKRPALGQLSETAHPAGPAPHPYVSTAIDQVGRLLEADPNAQRRIVDAMEQRRVPAEGDVISACERSALAARCALKARAGDIDDELNDLLQDLLRGREIDPIDVELARELCAGLRLNVASADVKALDVVEAALVISESLGAEAEEALEKAVVAAAESIVLRAGHAPALAAEALADYVEMVGVRIGAPPLEISQHQGLDS